MPRYVILHHVTSPDGERGDHWDFMLEAGGVLRTWALAKLPREGAEIAAAALADHRPAYLEYEGEISGGRGSVSRWDEGEYAFVQSEDERIAVSLRGKRLCGRVELMRTSGENWTWRYSAD